MSFGIKKVSQTYQLKTLTKKLTGVIKEAGQPPIPPDSCNPFYGICIGNSIAFSLVGFSSVRVEGGESIKQDGSMTIASTRDFLLKNWKLSSTLLLNKIVNDIKYVHTLSKWFATGLGDGGNTLIHSLNNDPPTEWQNIVNPPFTIGYSILPTSPILFSGIDTYGNTIAYSNDGINFTYSDDNPFPGGKCLNMNTKSLSYMSLAPDLRMAVGYDQFYTTTIASSNDGGVTWTSLPNPLDGGVCRDIRYNPTLGIWIAGGSNNGISTLYSNNGITYYSANTPLMEVYSIACSEDSIRTLVCGKDIVGNDKIAYSDDGINWDVVSELLPLSIIRKVIYEENKYLAVGFGSTPYSETTLMWSFGSGTNINEWKGLNTTLVDTPSSLLNVLEIPLVRSYVNDQNTTNLYESNEAVDKLRLWMGLDT